MQVYLFVVIRPSKEPGAGHFVACVIAEPADLYTDLNQLGADYAVWESAESDCAQSFRPTARLPPTGNFYGTSAHVASAECTCAGPWEHQHHGIRSMKLIASCKFALQVCSFTLGDFARTRVIASFDPWPFRVVRGSRGSTRYQVQSLLMFIDGGVILLRIWTTAQLTPNHKALK